VNHDRYPDAYIRDILEEAKTIAILGASPKEVRPSYFVARYMLDKGYRVFPINPGQAGKTILGQTVYATLEDVPEPIDIVDIFRNASAVPAIVESALTLDPKPKVIWMQLGIRHDESAAKAEAGGIRVVMDRCLKIEYGRLSGEIGWAGVNSRVLSSKKPLMRGGAQSWGISASTRKPRG
jgi:predicted CoA-binding protein